MKELIAKDLLSIGAVFLSPDKPFTWASGIKSPIYCDNRLTLTAPAVRTHIEEGLASLIKEKYPDAEVLMGTSTAGIAHAAITAHLLNMPMGYVRSGAKDHGRQNQIEGKLEKGQKVVVVEDLISTGGSVLEVVNVLREAGADVLGIVSIRHSLLQLFSRIGQYPVSFLKYRYGLTINIIFATYCRPILRRTLVFNLFLWLALTWPGICTNWRISSLGISLQSFAILLQASVLRLFWCIT